MNLSRDWLLSPGPLSLFGSVAAAAMVIGLLAIVADTIARRRCTEAGTRHAMLVGAVVMLLGLPGLAFVLQERGFGWSVGVFEPQGATPLPIPDLSATNAKSIEGASPLPASDVADESFLMPGRDEVISPEASQAPSYFEATSTEGLHPRPAGVADDSAGDVHPAVLAAEEPVAAVESPVSDPASERYGVIVRKIGTWLVVAWIVGLLAALARFLRNSRRLSRVVRSATPVAEPDLLAMLAQCLGEDHRERPERRERFPGGSPLNRWRWVGVRRPRLLWSEWVLSPMTCGLLRPQIVLPRRLAGDFDEDDWRAVLLHEVEHVARRDLFIGLLQRVATILYWWNLPLRWINARLDELREDLCDDAVLTRGVDREGYARLLVGVADAVTHPPLRAVAIGLTRATGFTTRISRLISEDRIMSSRISWKTQLLLCVVMFGLGGGVVAATLVRPPVESEQSPGESEQSLFVDSTSGSALRSNDISLAVQYEERTKEAPADNLAFADAPLTEPLAPLPAAGEANVAPAPAAELPRAEAPLEDPSFGQDPIAPTALPESPAATVQTTEPFAAEPLTRLNLPVSPAVESPRVAGTLVGEGTESSPFGIVTSRAPDRPILLLVTLNADVEGNLSELKFFNKSLGAGEAAVNSLREMLKERREKSEQLYGGRPSFVVQIEAPEALRYGHVKGVVEAITESGARMRFKVAGESGNEIPAGTVSEPNVKAPTSMPVSIVFVKDATGRKLSSRPVVCIDDHVLAPNQLAENLPMIFGSPGPAGTHIPNKQPAAVTISSDPEVEADVIENVVRDLSALGVEHIRLETQSASTTLSNPVYDQGKTYVPGNDLDDFNTREP